MIRALQVTEADLSVAHDGTRMQPVYALLPVRLADDLKRFLAGGERKIDRWYSGHRVALADFSDCPEAFRNVNTPRDREALQREGAPS